MLSPSVVSVATSSAAGKRLREITFFRTPRFKRRSESETASCKNRTKLSSYESDVCGYEFRPNVRALIGKFGGRGLKSARKLATKVTQWLRPSQMRSSTTGTFRKSRNGQCFEEIPKRPTCRKVSSEIVGFFRVLQFSVDIRSS